MQAPIGPATTTELVLGVCRVGAFGNACGILDRARSASTASENACEELEDGFCVTLVLAFDQRERLEIALAEGARFVAFSWGVDPEPIGRAHEDGAGVLVGPVRGNLGEPRERHGECRSDHADPHGDSGHTGLRMSRP
jgi:hypothetical protein